ncbi:MAG: NADH:flavin oxidoreductase [Armatimonadota bacterium]|nr:MAG: NADH:flavin oxidoreductase [Armatimonadota bacterium]
MSALFSPIEVKGVRFKNRVAMPPMVTLKADAEGCVTDVIVEHYAARARAGTGLVIVEATAVESGAVWRGGLAAFEGTHAPGLARLAERIHREGAVAAIQLVHGGPQASVEVTDGKRVGPSAVTPPDDGPIPRELAVEEIEAIEGSFVKAAERAIEVGFDGAEIHGAHNYLLDTFLSAKYNVREDGYGGSIRGRMRMLVETCRRAKERIGDRGLVWCRISIFNKLEEGFGRDELQELAPGLEETGIDMLHISTDGTFKEHFDSGKSIGQLVQGLCNLPVIVAGGLGDPADAERAVAEGHCDFAAVGNAMYEDARWTERARRTLEV